MFFNIQLKLYDKKLIFSETFAEMAKTNTDKYVDFLAMAYNLNKEQPHRASVLQYKPSANFPIECFVCYIKIF